MPILKDGSFLLDDSSCDPYGVIEVCTEQEHKKKESNQDIPQNGATGRNKQK